ncbi:MAG: PIN domain-containing protein [Candidatus Thermoplasmatota archaeon]
MVVLDTNFLVALRAQEPAAIRLLADLAGERLLVPSVVAVEFLTGFPDVEAARDGLERSFHVEHTNGDWLVAAARMRRRLRGAGRARLADAWIATWATLHDTFVVTRNETDFQRLGVRTRAW